MSQSITVCGVAHQYEAEAEAGIFLSTGVRWWGTRVKYRPGLRGAWRSFILQDVHPFDSEAVRDALAAVLEAGSVERVRAGETP
jgi:hypothetical protein